STTISSDNTRVPPVTAERSPPDSRMTGADSPVIADSSTAAMPSTTSPSPGMSWPGPTTQRSPTLSALDGVSTTEPLGRRTYATVSERVLRRVSAWALPRPSATASAKLANRTVNHNQMATSPTKTLSELLAVGRSLKNSTVVHALPTRTTNITGLRACTFGLSFLKESTIARRTIGPSRIPRPGRVRTLGGRVSGGGTRVSASAATVISHSSELAREVLDDRAQRHDREVRQADDDHHHAEQEAGEERGPGREGAGRRRDELLARERAPNGQHHDHRQHATRQHHEAERAVVPKRVCAQAAECGAVVVEGRRVRVDDLTETVRTRVGARTQCCWQHDGHRRERKDEDRR